MEKKLHIGCGDDIKEGWINHDVANLPGVDVVHDLLSYPWPWADEEFTEIYMKDVLEHLPDTIKTLEEIFRITKSGAKIYIAVPYWNSWEAITDPTHVCQFNEFSFDFFDPTKDRCKKRPYYSFARFEINKLGLGVSFLKPHMRLPIISRYTVFYNPIIKWFLSLFAGYFNNIVVGLELHLVRLNKKE